jgi:hypothetical protein
VSENVRRFTNEQRALRTQELFETFRTNLLSLYFPRELLIQLHNDPLVDCWSDANLITANLRTLLPIGRFITQEELGIFVDTKLPQIRDASREQLWYWHLSAATTSLNEPLDRLVVTPDEDRFWFHYVYDRIVQIREFLEEGTHLFWLDRFILDHRSIEIGFNEIRLSTLYSHALPAHLAALAPYYLVVTDGRDFHLNWQEGHWNTTLRNPDPSLINPRDHTLAPVIPESYTLRVPIAPVPPPIGPTITVTAPPAQPDDDETLPPSDDDNSHDGWNSPQPWTNHITNCWCRGELCTCGYRPDTPPTPPGIVLWTPRDANLPYQPGGYFQLGNQPGFSSEPPEPL